MLIVHAPQKFIKKQISGVYVNINMLLPCSIFSYHIKGQFRLRKAQSGIPKNYVITKIGPIRARFRKFPDVNSEPFLNFFEGFK